MELSLDKALIKFYIGVSIAFYVLTSFHSSASYPGQLPAVLINNFWNLTYITPLNFIFFEYTIPFVLKKRSIILSNIFLGILLFWIYLMLLSYGSYAWRQLGIQLHVYTPLKEFPTLNELLEYRMGYGAGSVFFFGIIRHIYNYVKLKQATQQLRIEKQGAELNYLKSQTNPHFLFNTLNNIYSLARDKSDLAPESILRLSKILRFMLYETGGDYIAIEKEITIISDYIDLEKLRYDESLNVNFNYSIEEMKQSLPPLLLLPLVENSFKHGVSETRGRPFVDIHLSVHKGQLTFVVKNSSEGAGDVSVNENIGLSNLRRQLKLLYKDYNLSVKQGESIFIATLKINLASHV